MQKKNLEANCSSSKIKNGQLPATLASQKYIRKCVAIPQHKEQKRAKNASCSKSTCCVMLTYYIYIHANVCLLQDWS